MKLSKFIINFNENFFHKQANAEPCDYKILRAYLPQVFPSRSVIENGLNNSLTPTTNFDNQFSLDNLSHHTRDNQWLSAYLEHIIKSSPKVSNKVNPTNIAAFVKLDTQFNAERNRFEEDVVAIEIKKLMQRCFDKKLNSTDVVANNISDSNYVDEIFRLEIGAQMQKQGIAAHSIEASLEKNAHLWREQTAEASFTNRYIRPLVKDPRYTSIEQSLQAVHQILSLRHDWLIMHEYDYYRRHRGIIDELGLATDNMQMSLQEICPIKMNWQHKINAYKCDVDYPRTQTYRIIDLKTNTNITKPADELVSNF